MWAAWAQTTKAYKYWKTERGYYALIGELYKEYPHLKDKIKSVHIRAQFLHTDGFYEGVYFPEEDVESIKDGVKIIEEILNERQNKSK